MIMFDGYLLPEVSVIYYTYLWRVVHKEHEHDMVLSKLQGSCEITCNDNTVIATSSSPYASSHIFIKCALWLAAFLFS